MKNRFYVPTGLQLGAKVQLDGDEFHHAVRVHRSQVGEEIELFDGKGGTFVGRIEEIGKSDATVDVVRSAERRDSPLRITLALALIQPDRFELALQKGTELGVHRFVPMITERGEVLTQRVANKLDRWRKILMEATKQSGRSVLPEIAEPTELGEILSQGGLRILFDAEAQPNTLPERTAEVMVLVGPEGGWTATELERAREAGCLFQSLGPRRLRAETAAIAAVTLTSFIFGDLSA